MNTQELREKRSKELKELWQKFDEKVLDPKNESFLLQSFKKRGLTRTYSSKSTWWTWDGFFPDQLRICVSCSSTDPFRIEAYSGDPKENYRIFSEFRRLREQLMDTMKADVRIHTGENETRHAIIFQPKGMAEGLGLDNEKCEKEAQALFEWINSVSADLEKVLRTVVERINQPASDYSKEVARDGLNDSE